MNPTHDDFYRHYEPFVRAYVARRAESGAVADLVADVFSIAWRRRANVPDNALPWLYRTARNVIGDSYRAADRQRALDERLAAVPSEPPADPAGVATERAELIDALGSLSDSDRELLLLAAWEGLEPADIADVLAITPGAATVRLHRARRRLQASLSTRIESAAEGNERSM